MSRRITFSHADFACKLSGGLLVSVLVLLVDAGVKENVKYPQNCNKRGWNAVSLIHAIDARYADRRLFTNSCIDAHRPLSLVHELYHVNGYSTPQFCSTLINLAIKFFKKTIIQITKSPPTRHPKPTLIYDA